MRISDWSSDVCSSDLDRRLRGGRSGHGPAKLFQRKLTIEMIRVRPGLLIIAARLRDLPRGFGGAPGPIVALRLGLGRLRRQAVSVEMHHRGRGAAKDRKSTRLNSSH